MAVKVTLVVPMEYSFPDTWIYIHDPEVKVGRVQNFGSWSPYLVKEGRTCLGLEFFVQEGESNCTISGVTASGGSSIRGSSPGIAFARIFVRSGPGLNRFTLTLVFAHSAA